MLTKDLEEKLLRAQAEQARLNQVVEKIAQLTDALSLLLTRIPEVAVFGEDQTAAEAAVQAVSEEVANITGNVNNFCSDTR